MRSDSASKRGFSGPLAVFTLCIVAMVVASLVFSGLLRRSVRESLMQRRAFAHYEILCPAASLPPDALQKFAAQREALFAELEKKLGGGGTNTTIRIIFDPHFSELRGSRSNAQPYSVSGTTIRTKLDSQSASLPHTADAEALLYAAWEKPGNVRIARWTVIWLTGEWRGTEIGMAAAEVEQKLGHKRLETVLSDPPSELPSLDDQDLLGAAWISEIAEFGGADAVRKLYAAKISHLNVAEVTKALGTTPLELERKWQMWMYAYLAGMPPVPRDSGMPMNMPMAGNH
jgi:hypothetical protein